jgi:flagellar biosynthesis/type III secretory pathway chaperone
MPSLSRTEARTQFIELLNDTVYQALGLKESLEGERKALESQDMECIETAVTSKSTRVLKLQDLDKKRSQLCSDCGFAAGPEQMQQLIAWCDESELVKIRWERLMMVAAESSALNMTNGAIIRVRQHQFESSLSVLRGVTPGADTYGRHGEESGGFGHQSLAEA